MRITPTQARLLSSRRSRWECHRGVVDLGGKFEKLAIRLQACADGLDDRSNRRVEDSRRLYRVGEENASGGWSCRWKANKASQKAIRTKGRGGKKKGCANRPYYTPRIPFDISELVLERERGWLWLYDDSPSPDLPGSLKKTLNPPMEAGSLNSKMRWSSGKFGDEL